MFINHFVESAVIILDLSTGISNLDISVTLLWPILKIILTIIIYR